MNILLVEDEASIREALASYLRIKGHRVVTAASCAEGLEQIAQGAFDLLITDWRIGGDNGEALVVASACPSIVVSGAPEEIGELGDRVRVLRKPVPPAELLEALESFAAPAPSGIVPGTAPVPRRSDALPCDCRDLVLLALALAGADEAAARIVDDGAFVTLEAPLPRGDQAVADLERLGGDLRVRGGATGDLRFALRICRDARPAEVEDVVPLGAEWPAGSRLAVDCHGANEQRLLEFVAALRRARRRRLGMVTFLNVPASWRLWLEIAGLGHLVPKRRAAGPRLPEFLSMLWSQA